MSFEAVRQIIESRIFSVSYTTVLGDSLTSISSQFNTTEEQVTRLNPDVDFANSLLVINFGNNDIRDFQLSGIEDFSEEELGTGFTTLQFRGSAFTPFNNSSAGTVFRSGTTVSLFSEISSTPLGIEAKVSDWVNLINGESTFGFTATIVSGGQAIQLTPKEGVTLTPTVDLTVQARNNFGVQPFEATVGLGIVLNLGSTLSFPMFLESRTIPTQPNNSNWAVLFINDAAVVGREFGNTRDGVRRSGTVRIALYAPRNEGTKKVRVMAENLDDILSYTAGDSATGNGGTLFVKAGSLTKVSDDDDGSLSYNLDYIYDYYTS